MDKELKNWLKSYFKDIFCGMLFWGVVFFLFVGIGLLMK